MRWCLLIGFCVCAGVTYALEPGATIPRSQDLPSQLPITSETSFPPQQTPTTPATEARMPEVVTPRFVLQELRLQGNTVFDDAELQQVVAPWLGKTVALVDLESIRFALAQYYRQAGYINSGVVLPQQHINNGSVVLQIIEGHIGTIRIQGAERLVERYIRARIQVDTEEVLKQQQLLERFQLLLNDPLIERLNAALKPGSKPSESELELQVTRRRPYALDVSMDNYTPASVGAYTGRLESVVRNLTGWGDALQLDLNYSAGLQGLQSLFSLPLAAGATRLNFSFQGNQAEIIDAPLQSLRIHNDFFHLGLALNHEFALSTQRSFTLEAQFAYRYSRSFILGIPLGLGEGSEENAKAKVSVLRFMQNYLHKSQERVFSLRSTFSVGTDFLDATVNQGLPDSRFFSWLGQGRYVQQLDKRGSELFLRADVQLASNSLLPLERFALGGVYSVRGYRQNELVRDNGFVLSAEFRYPLLFLEQYAGHTLKLVPFIDFGQVWNYAARTDSLWSLGLGLQWNWRQLHADVYWAEAMQHSEVVNVQSDLQDSGVHFRLSYKLL